MNAPKLAYYLFFSEMKQQYGLVFTTIFYQLKKLKNNQATYYARNHWYSFLRLHSMIPNELKLKKRQTNYNDKIYKLENTLFSKQIQENIYNLKKTNSELYKLLNLFLKKFSEQEGILTIYHLNNYKRHLDYCFYKKMKLRKEFYNKKFNLKKPIIRYKTTIRNEEVGFINKSNFTFNIQETEMLNKGPKHTIDGSTNKDSDIILKSDTEMIMREILSNDINNTYGDIKNINNLQIRDKTLLYNLKNDILSNIPKINKSEDQEILNNLQKKTKNSNLIFVTADKSNTIVAIDKSSYIEGMETALKKNNFVEVTKDNFEKNERILQGLLRECLQNNYIDHTTYKKIYPSGSKPCNIYGKAKTHKEEGGFRPIVNTKDSYFTETSKWLKGILDKYKNKKYAIKNSLQLKNELKYIKLKPGNFMFSLDVTNMYGSVNIEEVSKYILNRFRLDKHKKSTITQDLLDSILNICTRNIQSNFEGKKYIQTSGCSMGGNLSPLLADLQLWIIEKQIMEKFGNEPDKKVLFYKRYVDDCIFVVSNENDSQIILEYCNNLKENIKFTMEKENNGLLNYLDITLLRKDEELHFKIFKKQTQNNLKINFNSNYSNKIKYNILLQEIKKAYEICSNERLLANQLRDIKNNFILNNYPPIYIENCIRHINSQFTKFNYIGKKFKNTEENEERNTKYIKIDSDLHFRNIQKTFNKFKKENNSSKLENIKLVKGGPIKMIDLLKNINKDKSLQKYNKGIIYEAKCKICQSKYIGSTQRNYNVRLSEHLKNKTSGIYQHINKTKHNICIDDVKILTKQKNKTKRFVIESLYIDKYKPSLNNERGVSLIIDNL